MKNVREIEMAAIDYKSLIGILITLIIAAVLALAGSVESVLIIGIPLFALCIAIAFLIQWIAFIPAYLKKTEKFYDLTGSITYTTVVLVALLLTGRFETRSLILSALVLIWTLRLGIFLFRRVLKAGEDKRFKEIKQSGSRFLLTWSIQGLWVSFTVAAAVGAITAVQLVDIGILEIIGLVIWIAGFGFEAIADYQKSKFRAIPENKGKFIKSGLWSISRHPNYFGEIILWIGVAVIAFPALRGWSLLTLVSPVFVILLLTKVSGVPLLENYADKKWGGQEDYEEYKKNTPVLIPKLPF